MTEKLPVNLQLNKMQQPKSIKFGNTASTIPVQKDEDEAEKKRKEGLMVATLVGLATAALAGGIYYNRHPGKWQEHTGKVKDFFKGNKGKAGASSVETSAPPIPIPASEATNSSTAIQLTPHAKKAEIEALCKDKGRTGMSDGNFTFTKEDNVVIVKANSDPARMDITDVYGNIIGERIVDSENSKVTRDTIFGFTKVDKNHRPYEKMKIQGVNEYRKTYSTENIDLKAGDKPLIIDEIGFLDGSGKLKERRLVKQGPGGKKFVTVQKYQDGKKVKTWTAEGTSLSDADNVVDTSKLLKSKEYDNNVKRVYMDVKNQVGSSIGYSEEIYNYSPTSAINKTGKAKTRKINLVGKTINLKDVESHATLKDNLKADIKDTLKNHESTVKDLKIDERTDEQLLHIYSTLSSASTADLPKKASALVKVLNYSDDLKGKSLSDLMTELNKLKDEVQNSNAKKNMKKEIATLSDNLQNMLSNKTPEGQYNANLCELFKQQDGTYPSGLSEDQVKARLSEYLLALKDKKDANGDTYNKLGTKALLNECIPYYQSNKGTSIPQDKRLRYSSAVRGSALTDLLRNGIPSSPTPPATLEKYLDYKAESKSILKRDGAAADYYLQSDNKQTASGTKAPGDIILPDDSNSLRVPDREFGIDVMDNGSRVSYRS